MIAFGSTLRDSGIEWSGGCRTPNSGAFLTKMWRLQTAELNFFFVCSSGKGMEPRQRIERSSIVISRS